MNIIFITTSKFWSQPINKITLLCPTKENNVPRTELNSSETKSVFKLPGIVLPRPPNRLRTLRPGVDSHRADSLRHTGERSHSVDRRRYCGRGAGVDRTSVHRDRYTCVRVEGDNRGGGVAKRGVGDQKRELSICSRHKLEPPEHFGGHRFRGAEFGSHLCAVDGQGGGELDVKGLGEMGRLRSGLLGVVHGDHLAHAAGQVVEETGSNLGVHPLAGGQEAGDFVHAFVESCTVLAQHCGVG